MVYRFETNHDRAALTAIAKCLRKTVLRKKSRRTHIWGWIVIAWAALLAVMTQKDGFTFDLRAIIVGIAVIAGVLIMIFEDGVNGAISKKNLLKGAECASIVFDPENPAFYVSECAAEKAEYPYGLILVIAETENYFVFILDEKHGQICDKRALSGGDVDSFRQFIRERTGKEIVPVK